MFFGLGAFGLAQQSGFGWLPGGANMVTDFLHGHYYDGTKPVLFSDFITFTRASSGTYFDSNGVMQTAGTDTPRFNYEYNGSSWVVKGLLVEPAATNLLLRSREFDNGAWTKTDTTITANSINGVGGTATMSLCTEGSAGTAGISQAALVAAGSTNTFAMDLNRGNHDWVRYFIYDASTGTHQLNAWFNLATGAVGTVSNAGSATGAAASIRNLGNGIYRCILTGSHNLGAPGNIRAEIRSASADASSTRVSGATRYQDRAQLESGSVATSFIETTTATATRAADVAVISGANFSSWFNPNEGVFVVEATAAPGTRSGAQGVFSVNDGTTSNVMNAARQNATNFMRWNGTGSPAGDITLGAVANSAAFKLACAYKANDWAACLNGGSVGTDTSAVVPTVTRMGIGSLDGLFDPGAQWVGHIARITYYPTRFSNAQLVTLST